MKLSYYPIGLVNKYTNRLGFLVTLEAEDGTTSWGESAPFPSFGTETVRNCQEALQIIGNNSLSSISRILKKYKHLPTLCHGVEQALLHFLAQQQNLSLAELFNPYPSDRLVINGLIGRVSPSIAVQETIKLVEAGITCIKVKVGQEGFSASYDRLLAIYETAGKYITIRLDPNQSWTAQETINYLHKLSFLPLDYIEDPTPNPTDWLMIKQHTGIKIGWDQVVTSSTALQQLINSGWVDVLIIKPMFYGSLIKSYYIGKLAQDYGLSVVVTNTLEGWVGTMGARELARALHISTPCGFSCVSWYLSI